MEPLKPNFPTRGRAAFLGAALLVVPLISSGWIHGQDLSEKEYSRRAAAVEEAQELLRKGDEAYLAGRYAEAVEAFAGARDLIPDGEPSIGLLDEASCQEAVQAVLPCPGG